MKKIPNKIKIITSCACLIAINVQAALPVNSCRIGARAFRHGTNSQASVNAFTAVTAGKGMGIYMHYTSFSGRWSPAQAELAKVNGSIFHMKFVPENNKHFPQNAIYRHIGNGQCDHHFRYIADRMTDWLRQPGTKSIWFDFAHEMNGSWKPYRITAKGTGNDAKNFKAAWKRMRGVIRSRLRVNGVNEYRVKFIFAPSRHVWGIPEAQIQNIYPGNQYVDYVGCSAYNESSRWKHLGPLIYGVSADLDEATGGQKYFGFSEVGSDRDSRRPSWIKSNFREAYFKNLDINYFNWYDAKINGNYQLGDKASQDAFRSAMASKFFIK